MKNEYSFISRLEEKELTNVYLIYGIHSCLSALLNPNRKIHKILVVQSLLDEIEDEISKEFHNLIRIVDKPFLNKRCRENHSHQGIMIHTERLEQPSVDEVFENNNSEPIVILDSLVDAGNIGAIMRCSYLMGCKTVVLLNFDKMRENARLVKTASGSIETLNILNISNDDENQFFEKLKTIGYEVVGLDLAKNSVNMNDIKPLEKIAIVMGNEKEGIRDKIKDNCDKLMIIPMSTENKYVDSFNVSNSLAITLTYFKYIK